MRFSQEMRFFFVVCLLMPSQGWTQDPLEITNITNDPSRHHDFPDISGDTIVWSGESPTFFFNDIYRYQNGQITNLTSDPIRHHDKPAIDGDTIVWSGESPQFSFNDIYRYQNGQITNLTSDSLFHDEPAIAGNTIVWSGENPAFFFNDIYRYQNGVITNLTNDPNTWHIEPDISGSTIVWSGESLVGGQNFHDIYRYQSGEVTNLTDNPLRTDRSPIVQGSTVYWHAGTHSTGLFDVLSIQDGVEDNISNDPIRYHLFPDTSGPIVVWTGESEFFLFTDIYMFDGTDVYNLTNDPIRYHGRPAISGSTIVWSGESPQFFFNDIYMAELPCGCELITGSPAGISQIVDTPNQAFDISFEYRFKTETGALSVLLDGVELETILAPSEPTSEFDVATIQVDGALLNRQNVVFQIVLDGETGSKILLDDISFPGLENGDFQSPDLDGWAATETGCVKSKSTLDDSYLVDAGTLLGDVNLDGQVNLLDVTPFVKLITNGLFQIEADINQDGAVNLLDVTGFVELLSS